MLGDVEMQDTPAIVTDDKEDDKEAVENTQADRGHGEEVRGRNRFPVIRKKHAPALGWLGLSAPSLSSGRWSSRTRQSPTGKARRECEAPRVGFSALSPTRRTKTLRSCSRKSIVDWRGND